MTSTSVTKIGGVVVVTQVIPQDDKSIPLQSAVAAAPTPTFVQATPTIVRAPPPARQPPPKKMDDMTSIFLKAGPHCLGVVQIFIGLLCVLFGLTAIYSPVLLVHAPFCGAVTFVVSGSVAVAAVRRTTFNLVRASLVWNLIGAVVGLGGVAYTCWLLAYSTPAQRFCDTVPWGDYEPTDEQMMRCRRDMWMMNVTIYGALGLTLVLLVLQVSVAVTVCVFSVGAIRRHDCYAPLRVEVDDVSVRASSPVDSDDALLGSDESFPPNSP